MGLVDGRTTHVNSAKRRAKGKGTMLIPVRCFSCGKVIADKWRAYQTKVQDGDGTAEAKRKALDALALKRICCRRMFLGNVDLIDDI